MQIEGDTGCIAQTLLFRNLYFARIKESLGNQKLERLKIDKRFVVSNFRETTMQIAAPF